MATLIEEIEELDDKCYLDSHHGYWEQLGGGQLRNFYGFSWLWQWE